MILSCDKVGIIYVLLHICVYVCMAICMYMANDIGRAVDARELFDAIVSRIDALVGDGGGGGHGGDEL